MNKTETLPTGRKSRIQCRNFHVAKQSFEAADSDSVGLEWGPMSLHFYKPLLLRLGAHFEGQRSGKHRQL